jgi:iron-sulfur cluster repair protein YtfE (RIC family)
MDSESLGAALEREHHEIDAGIEEFTRGPASDREPLTRAFRALRRHIYLEEEFLFPPLHAAGLVGPIMVMLREHGQIWETMDALEGTLEGTEPDADPATLRKLTVQLLHHNLKEEKIIYPEVARVLAEPATGRLLAFLDSGELPEGWVCFKARNA